MNRVSVNKKALKEALTLARKLTNVKSTKAVLQCVHLSSTPGTMHIKATDLETFLWQRINTNLDSGPFDIVIDAKLLADALKHAPGEKLIEIAVERKALKLPCCTLEATIDSSEFPYMPAFKAENHSFFRLKSIKNMYRRTQFAAAKDMGCYAYNGLLFNGNGRVAGTDGRRLAISETTATDTADWDAIIPKQSFEIASKAFKDEDDLVKVSSNEKMIHFSTSGNADVYARKLEGSFPCYGDVIPENQHPVAVDRISFQAAIEQAATLTKGQELPKVSIKLQKGGMRIRALAPGSGSMDTTLDATKSLGHLNGLTATFDPTFILDWLKSLNKVGKHVQSENTMKKDHDTVYLFFSKEPKGKECTQAVVFQDPDDVLQKYIVAPITTD